MELLGPSGRNVVSAGGLGKELNRYGNQKEDRVSYRRLENSNGLPV